MRFVIFPLQLGVFVRASADVLVYAYLPLYLRAHIGETRFWLISLIPTVPAFVRFVMAPVWGRLADGAGRQRPFIAIGLCAYGILLGALPLMHGAAPMVFGLALSAAFFSAFNPVSRTWLSLGKPGEAVFRLAHWHQWEAAGFVAGSAALGWWMADHPGAFMDAVRVGAVLLVGCAAAIYGLLRDRPAGIRVSSRRRRAGGSAGVSTRRKRKAGQPRTSWLRRVVTLLPPAAVSFLVVSSAAWESVATSFGLYFTESLSGSVRMYGLTLSGSTFVSLVAYGLLAAVGERRGEALLFRAAAWGYTVMFLLIAWPSPWTAAAGYLLPISTVVRTAFNLLIVRRVPKTGRGEAMGVMEAVEACSGTIGGLTGGVVADNVGLPLTPQVALWSSLLLHLLTRRMRLRRQP